jgi:hypothetical protein
MKALFKTLGLAALAIALLVASAPAPDPAYAGSTENKLLRIQIGQSKYLSDNIQKPIEPGNPNAKAVIVQDRTLLPIRVIGEEMGYQVEWNNGDREVDIKDSDITLNLKIGSRTATVNGKAVTLDVPAQIIGNKTMVPLRFVAEEMGCTVDWDNASRTVFVAIGNATIPTIPQLPARVWNPKGWYETFRYPAPTHLAIKQGKTTSVAPNVKSEIMALIPADNYIEITKEAAIEYYNIKPDGFYREKKRIYTEGCSAMFTLHNGKIGNFSSYVTDIGGMSSYLTKENLAADYFIVFDGVESYNTAVVFPNPFK